MRRCAMSNRMNLPAGGMLTINADVVKHLNWTWANMDVGNGKIFVAWEDIRDDYPPQYDFFPRT